MYMYIQTNQHCRLIYVRPKILNSNLYMHILHVYRHICMCTGNMMKDHTNSVPLKVTQTPSHTLNHRVKEINVPKKIISKRE